MNSERRVVLRERLLANDPERIARVEAAAFRGEIAQHVYELRSSAGLTQEELAVRTGVPRSVIDELERWEHEGDSLALLGRIASALGYSVRLRLVPVDEPAALALEEAAA